MTLENQELDDFEKRTRALLEESVTRIDGRIRSRLNQARHAALAELERPRKPFWRSFALAPGAAAAGHGGGFECGGRPGPDGRWRDI